MTYSFKTLIAAAIIFIASLAIVGSLHLPIHQGKNGFEAMESTFNSLRKGVKPPFKKIAAENNQYLGKNFKATITFKDNGKARTATMMFLRNKLTVSPKGKTIHIQGDLGYTLQFFMNDIHLLYMHKFDQLDEKYSMPAINSMYMMDRILKKLAVFMASQRMTKQEDLINKIRRQLLIPAYNLRDALPISETSGFLYLSLGTVGILIFTILWDASNFLFFGTLASKDFMKTIRIALGREKSEAQIKAELKRKKMKQKAKAAKIKKAKAAKAAKADGPKTDRKTLKKIKTPENEKGKAAPKKAVSQKKLKSDTTTKRASKPQIKPSTNTATKNGAVRKKTLKKSAQDASKKTSKTAKSAASKNGIAKSPRKKAAPSKAVPEKKEANKAAAKTASNKKEVPATSQTVGKKVTTPQGKAKTAAKAAPEGQRQVKKKAPVPQTDKKIPAPKKAKAKQRDDS
ncbi:hypothetical protein [Maridesulfovibrio hydrothermalis]|uniref:Uncharacterized protein n=1 Tax=Maridesulfovibrio hydrothermalis AM13 = DSM 14728 TaxID=1121451 RepID=L0REU8_9BACT|nr:hypothetical protein [Maridesulfovibrio hydrothermalis]CCO25308.1 conserved exported protein of unknown function [Maridesulfovibrio hydrothermalis AM13 = DSM 14728]